MPHAKITVKVQILHICHMPEWQANSEIDKKFEVNYSSEQV